MAKHKRTSGSTGIYVDGGTNKNGPEQARELARAIERVLAAGFKTHAEQDTIQRALGVLEHGTHSDMHTTITGSSFEMAP